MANSFQIAVRSGIMIVTMVAIPLLAIFGKQLPELLNGIYRGNTASDQWQTRPSEPVAAPSSNIGTQQLAAQQQRADLTAAPAYQAQDNAAVSAKADTPAPLAGTAFQGAQPLPLKPQTPPGFSQVTLNQALPPSNLNPGAAPLRDASVTPAAAGSETQGLASNAFQQGQQRLRELGARYFKLETTGEASERYRAVCQVNPMNGGPVQSYSAIHTDPLAAQQQLIEQIERSRTQPSVAQQPVYGDRGRMYR